jgi:hypothetical protein
MSKKQLFILILGVVCVFQCGCAVLQIPLAAIGLVKTVVGGALQVIQKLPKPPPWVFF